MTHYERMNHLKNLLDRYIELRSLAGNRCKNIYEAIKGLSFILDITDDEAESLSIMYD